MKKQKKKYFAYFEVTTEHKDGCYSIRYRSFYSTTYAVSTKQARNNLVFQFANNLTYENTYVIDRVKIDYDENEFQVYGVEGDGYAFIKVYDKEMPCPGVRLVRGDGFELDLPKENQKIDPDGVVYIRPRNGEWRILSSRLLEIEENNIKIERMRFKRMMANSPETDNPEDIIHRFCVWYLAKACYYSTERCKHCRMFINYRSDEGAKLLCSHDYEVEMALLPVRYLYGEKFKEYTKEKDPIEYEIVYRGRDEKL